MTRHAATKQEAIDAPGASGFTLIEVLAAVVILATLTVAGASWFRSAGAAQGGIDRRLAVRQAVRDLAANLPSPAPIIPQPVPGHADWWWRVIDLHSSGFSSVPASGLGGAPVGVPGPAHHWRQVVICAGRDLGAPVLGDALLLGIDE